MRRLARTLYLFHRHQAAIRDLRLVEDQLIGAGQELKPQVWLTLTTAGIHLRRVIDVPSSSVRTTR